MKSKLGVAIALATLAPAISFAEPTVYGKLNLTLEPVVNQIDQDTGNEQSFVNLKDNSSRFGLKGSEELSEGLSAIYLVEFGTSIDSGDNVISRRSSWVGLKGGFGQVIAGVFDTPTKASQGKIDQFNDLRGDIAERLTQSDARTGNSIMYSTPGESFNANVMYMTREDEDDGDASAGVSLSFTYTAESFYAALAYDKDVAILDSTNLRLSLAGTFGPVELGGMIEQLDIDGSDDTRDAMMVSLGYKTSDATKLKLQFGTSDELRKVDSEGVEVVSIGVDHKYTKNFTTYAYYTKETADNENLLDNDYLGLGAIFLF